MVPKYAGWRCSLRPSFFGLNGAGGGHCQSSHACTRGEQDVQLIPRSYARTKLNLESAHADAHPRQKRASGRTHGLEHELLDPPRVPPRPVRHVQRHRVVVVHLQPAAAASHDVRLEVALVLARAARGAVRARGGARAESAALGDVLRARVGARELLEDEEAREALDARDRALEDLGPARVSTSTAKTGTSNGVGERGHAPSGRCPRAGGRGRVPRSRARRTSRGGPRTRASGARRRRCCTGASWPRARAGSPRRGRRRTRSRGRRRRSRRGSRRGSGRDGGRSGCSGRGIGLRTRVGRGVGADGEERDLQWMETVCLVRTQVTSQGTESRTAS